MIAYLKKVVNENEDSINILCVIAYCGLLNAREDDDIWLLKREGNTTLAHWVAMGEHLRFAYNSAHWCVQDNSGDTPGHYTASNVTMNASYNSELWCIKNESGSALTHWAARNGCLNVHYNSDLSANQSKYLGDTPAHQVTPNGFLKAPTTQVCGVFKIEPVTHRHIV